MSHAVTVKDGANIHTVGFDSSTKKKNQIFLSDLLFFLIFRDLGTITQPFAAVGL